MRGSRRLYGVRSRTAGMQAQQPNLLDDFESEGVPRARRGLSRSDVVQPHLDQPSIIAPVSRALDERLKDAPPPEIGLHVRGGHVAVALRKQERRRHGVD